MGPKLSMTKTAIKAREKKAAALKKRKKQEDIHNDMVSGIRDRNKFEETDGNSTNRFMKKNYNSLLDVWDEDSKGLFSAANWCNEKLTDKVSHVKVSFQDAMYKQFKVLDKLTEEIKGTIEHEFVDLKPSQQRPRKRPRKQASQDFDSDLVVCIPWYDDAADDHVCMYGCRTVDVKLPI
jgi:hypothetical protein